MNTNLFKVIKYFYKEVWEKKGQYFLILVLMILSNSIIPFINLLLPKAIISELMGKCDIHKLLFIILIIVLSNFILGSIINILNAKLKMYHIGFEKHFERLLSKQVMEMHYVNTENPKILNQIQRAEEGMGWYSGGIAGLTTCLMTFVSSVIILSGTSVVIANASPLLFVICMIAVLACTYVVGKVNDLEVKQFEKGPDINRKFNYVYRELTELKYAKEVRTFDIESLFINIGKGVLIKVGNIFKQTLLGKLRWGYINSIITSVKNVCIYCYLSYLAVTGIITIADFSMLVGAATSFKDNLQKFITQFQEMQKKANFMYEYVQIMQENKVNTSQNMILKKDVKISSIVFENVSFKYPRTSNYVLRNVSITINEGEKLSIVGKNGAGKTTFIKLFCRLYEPTEGVIKINGIDSMDYSFEEYIKLISVVFQDFRLFAMSIRDNIYLDSKVSNQAEYLKLLKKCGLEQTINSLPEKEYTQISKMFDETGIEPSGGQAQKLAIARAIYKDAPIVILDEPTAALYNGISI